MKIIKGKKLPKLFCYGGNYGRKLSLDKFFQLEKDKKLKAGDWSVQYIHLLDYQYNDGGREEAGYKGFTGDCVVRAISIVTGLSYQKVYDDLYNQTREWRLASNSRHAKAAKPEGDSPRTGVYKDVYKPYLEKLGYKWIPTMFVGKGCKVHLRKNELPMGKLIVSVSKHITTVIDGVLNDTYDCSRDGERCVYGYFIKEGK